MSADRSLTLDGQTAPPVLVALRIAADVFETTGQSEQARRFARLSDELTERWCDSPDSHQAHDALELLISGFEDDRDARVYLTDLCRMLAISAPDVADRWVRRVIEGRANR